MARGRAVVTIPVGAVRALSEGAGSPGGRMLVRLADRVAAYAKVNATGHGTIPDGIYVGPVTGKAIKVISSNPHTVLVHNGSRAHVIRPRRTGGVLRFVIGGRVVYARRVNHPGYKGDPFLVKALEQVR